MMEGIDGMGETKQGSTLGWVGSGCHHLRLQKPDNNAKPKSYIYTGVSHLASFNVRGCHSRATRFRFREDFIDMFSSGC